MNKQATAFHDEIDTAWSRMARHSATLQRLREMSNPVPPPVIIDAAVDSLHNAVQSLVALCELDERNARRLQIH